MGLQRPRGSRAHLGQRRPGSERWARSSDASEVRGENPQPQAQATPPLTGEVGPPYTGLDGVPSEFLSTQDLRMGHHLERWIGYDEVKRRRVGPSPATGVLVSREHTSQAM